MKKYLSSCLATVGKDNPKFVKKYADVHKVAVDAVSQFVQECHDGTYPGPEHCYKMKAGEEEKLKELLKEQGL